MLVGRVRLFALVRGEPEEEEEEEEATAVGGPYEAFGDGRVAFIVDL